GMDNDATAHRAIGAGGACFRSAGDLQVARLRVGGREIKSQRGDQSAGGPGSEEGTSGGRHCQSPSLLRCACLIKYHPPALCQCTASQNRLKLPEREPPSEISTYPQEDNAMAWNFGRILRSGRLLIGSAPQIADTRRGVGDAGIHPSKTDLSIPRR